jgi:hydroxyquinol 1,2-dioxygenase
LITHIFRNDSDYLDSDSVFGVRQTLVTEWVEQTDGTFKLEFDFVLNPVG